MPVIHVASHQSPPGTDTRGNPSQPALIALLRVCALECRAAARPAPHEACALLHPDADAVDHATALARRLPELLLRRPVIWAPGAAGRSFDESWLLAVARALVSEDRASVRFLLRRHARPTGHAVLSMLLRGMVARLRTARSGDGLDSFLE